MLYDTDLDQFTGTEQYYQHSFANIRFTDGVKYLADTAKVYWLIDAIASYQKKQIVDISFQLWELTVNADHSAILTMRNDSGCPVLVKQRIPYTDYPMPKIKLWLSHRVLMLPTEY